MGGSSNKDYCRGVSNDTRPLLRSDVPTLLSRFARLHALLVDDDPIAQVCSDLPESECRAKPHNYGVTGVSLSLTRVGDGLADPKLVLAGLLDAIGTPTGALGLLVPVRESLAMLPQLVISARIRRL